MSFLAYIPARKNSKRVKKKNIKLLGGKPLILHTLNAAFKSKLITNIYISSDDPKIKIICKKNNFEFNNYRKKKYSNDKAKIFDLIKFEYNNILKKKFEFKYLVLLQPTSPLRTFIDINKACKLILKNNNSDCLVSTTNVSNNCDKKKIMFSDGKYLSYNMTNKFNIPRLRNGPAILIVKKKKLNNFLLGGKILDYKMPYKKSLDINTNKDFKKIRYIYKQKHIKN